MSLSYEVSLDLSNSNAFNSNEITEINNADNQSINNTNLNRYNYNNDYMNTASLYPKLGNDPY